MPGLSPRLQPIPIPWTAAPSATTQIAADKKMAIFKAPFACQVIDAGFAQTAVALAKTASKYTSVKVLNGGAAGSGTSVIGSVDLNKAATAAAESITALALSATTAWHKLDAGDYLIVLVDINTTAVGGCLNGTVLVIPGFSV